MLSKVAPHLPIVFTMVYVLMVRTAHLDPHGPEKNNILNIFRRYKVKSSSILQMVDFLKYRSVL